LVVTFEEFEEFEGTVVPFEEFVPLEELPLVAVLLTLI